MAESSLYMAESRLCVVERSDHAGGPLNRMADWFYLVVETSDCAVETSNCSHRGGSHAMQRTSKPFIRKLFNQIEVLYDQEVVASSAVKRLWLASQNPTHHQ